MTITREEIDDWLDIVNKEIENSFEIVERSAKAYEIRDDDKIWSNTYKWVDHLSELSGFFPESRKQVRNIIKKLKAKGNNILIVRAPLQFDCYCDSPVDFMSGNISDKRPKCYLSVFGRYNSYSSNKSLIKALNI